MSNEDKMNIDERQKYLRRMKKRYVRAGRKEQGRLLDENEFCAQDSAPIRSIHPVCGHTWLGKAKTALQIIAISLLIIYERLGEFENLGPIALWLAMIATLISGVDYLIRYGPQVVRGSVAP